jgi:lysophospholipase L1-like esterase
MKKLLLLLLLLPLIACSQSGVLGVVARRPLTRLTGFGNSIMEGNGQGSLPFHVNNHLPLPYTLRAHPGYTTTQLLPYIDSEVLPDAPSHVLMDGGVNDLVYGSASTVIANYATMLAKLRDAGAVPVCLLIMPCTNLSTTGWDGADAVNAWLREQVPAYGGVVIDLSTVVGQFRPGGPAGNRRDIVPSLTTDGTHFTYAANNLIGQTIAEVLRGL